jgi:phosphatidylglycerophosphate synthase
MEPKKDSADCYAASERGWMEAWQHWRGRALAPLLVVLTRLQVKPEQLTLLSLLSGLSFSLLFPAQKVLALCALALHALFDGLDGPLARHQGSASRKGSFTDTFCDQLVVVSSTLSLMQGQFLGQVPGVLYIVAYTIVVAFAMLRNALRIPYSWLLRPRLIVYCWIAVEVWLLPGTLELLVWICNSLFFIKVVSGFLKIRAQL